jgi:hypothetical protein
VPPWLRSSLRVYVLQAIDSLSDLHSIERSLRIVIPTLYQQARVNMDMYLNSLVEDDDFDSYLDIVDHCLGRTSSLQDLRLLEQLNQSLHEGGSAYEVGDLIDANGKPYFGLRKRVPEGVAQAVDLASGHERAGEHLKRAFTSAYGRDPNPNDAYSHAVKAVEAAAQPIVSPSDSAATLGKMIGVLRDSPRRFRAALTGRAITGVEEPQELTSVDAIKVMMQVLWTSQHTRHVSTSQEVSIAMSQAEAEAGVHLAATLVQWFSSGAIVRILDSNS